MAREFVVSAGGQTILGTTTLVFLNPPAAPNFNIEILRAWVSQSANNTSAQQRVQLVTQASAFPTLVSATPQKLRKADPNASVLVGATTGAQGTAGINASAENGGAKTVIQEDAFNVLNGWVWVPTPDERIVLPAGFAQGFGLFLPVAPASLANWAFGVAYREV